ncbi:hypothetical protein, partial [Blautia obeum]|uniref:hypothetical protein n=1 Tax=Blautia obeum TaxID=40520 RepID=UPI00319DE053
DLNPHERNAHKILSLARLPVPTLPHIAFRGNRLPRDNRYYTQRLDICQYLFLYYAEDGT